MKPKKSIGLLPPEEWDFRNLPERTDLQTVIEYEYLRSSPLRAVIEEWHSKPFADTSLATRTDSFRFLREAGVVSFPDRSPIGKLQMHMDHPELFDIEESIRLRELALLQVKKLKPSSLKVREVIQAIFIKLQDRNVIDSLLLDLDLPDEIADKHADDIALRFDCFPRAWLDVCKTEGEEYLAKRTLRMPPTAPAMWEIVHEEDTAMIGLEPGCRVESFVIDWSRSAPDISAVFKAWLSARHPASAAGHRIAEGWLRKLAAYRLKCEAGYSYVEAIDLVQQQKKTKTGANFDALPTSGAKTNWSQAVNDVKRLLDGDFIAAIRCDFGKMTPDL